MKEITAAEFEKEVLNGGNVVLDFYSSECPPCEALAPKFELLSNIYGDDIKFLKIFRQNNRELSNQLGISSSPTLVFFKNGKEVGNRLSGGVKKSEIMSVLDTLISEQRAIELKAQFKHIHYDYDVVILGGGPAGLVAGIYLAQAKIKSVIIDPSSPGGQVSTTHLVSNYPGFIEPINGYMLSHNMSEQAKKAGVDFKVAVDITSIDLENKTVVVDGFETYKAKKILITTGASPRFLGVEGEKEYKGHGISYCATCDAKYFHDKEVVIIGGGNTAVEESEFISKFASKITMIHQFDKLTSNKDAQEKLFSNNKINVLFNSEPRKFQKVGDKMVVTYENLESKELNKIETDGVFVFVGMKPNLDLISNLNMEIDQWGYIKTDEDMHTSIKDVFAAGDVISKKYRQITTAVGDGTIASIVIAKELET